MVPGEKQLLAYLPLHGLPADHQSDRAGHHAGQEALRAQEDYDRLQHVPGGRLRHICIHSEYAQFH